MSTTGPSLLEELVHSVLTSTQDFDAVCQRNADRLTPELAREAHALAINAMRAQRFGLAQRAAMVASQLFLRLGDREQSLRAMFDYHQVLFMAANDLEVYGQAIEGSRFVQKGAVQINALDLAFDAFVLGADGAYFSGQLVEQKEQGQWLRQCLEELAASTAYISHGTRGGIERFASLLASAAAQAQSSYWSEDRETVEELLRRLAAASDDWVPLEFTFAEGARKSIFVARSLAALSARYGNEDVAQQRLQVAITMAERHADIGTWMEAVEQLYRVACESLSSRARPAELRLSMKARMEEFRKQFRSRAGRLWVAQELDHTFSQIVRDSLRHSESTDVVFDFVESLKARLLSDQMQGAWKELEATEAAERLTAVEQEILSFRPLAEGEASSEELELSSLQTIGVGRDPEQRAMSLRELESAYAQQAGGYAGSLVPATLREVTSALEPGEVLLEFCVPYRWNHPAPELWVLAVRREGVRVLPLPIGSLPTGGFIGRMVVDGRAVDVSPLGSLAFSLRGAIRTGDEDAARRSLRLMHRLLIEPLLHAGIRPEDCRRWVVVPSGVLHHVPFAALENDEGRALIERVALSTAPSASIWLRLQSRPPGAVKRFLALANPTLPGGDHQPLPGAEREVQEVCTLLDGIACETYEGVAATEARLVKSAPGKELLHVSTHGGSPGQDAIDFHRLLLAPAGGHDGRVHASEVRRLDLHAARLVVLSICDGGLYRIGPGNEPYGLIAALLAAGVQNILATLWPLDDEMGRQLVVEMYRHLLQAGPAEALRQGCLERRRTGLAVRDWAAFTLVGPGRPLVA